MDVEKILYICSVDISQSDGPGVNETEFFSAIALRDDVQVTAIIPTRKHSTGLESGVTSFIEYGPDERRGIINLLKGQLALRKTLKTTDFDQYSSIIIRLPLLPLGLNRLIGRKYFVKTYGDPNFMRRYPGIKGVAGRILFPLVRRLHNKFLTNAKHVDCVTDQLASQLFGLYDLPESKVTIIPNGVNIDKFTPSKKLYRPHDSVVVGYVGGNPDQRGGIELLRLKQRLEQKGKTIKLLIIGAPNQKCIDLRTNLFGNEESIDILGHVPFDKIPELMKRIDIAYAIAPQSRIDKAGTSWLKIRQYLATGLPVISVNLNMPELKSGKVIFEVTDPHNIDELEIKFNEAIQEYSLRCEDMKKRAREYAVENLSSISLLDRRINIMRSLS